MTTLMDILINLCIILLYLVMLEKFSIKPQYDSDVLIN